jgi:peptide deformylase
MYTYTYIYIYQLRAVNEEIIVFDDALVQNAREMLMIMHASEGVGLAAPQVIFPILKTLF